MTTETKTRAWRLVTVPGPGYSNPARPAGGDGPAPRTTLVRRRAYPYRDENNGTLRMTPAKLLELESAILTHIEQLRRDGWVR